MYLEKIEIIGFKSFADKTVIHFSEPITAIVGPNGCGKSNVVDAFRWVLGGPSAKSLRSEKMVDVIFSGTEKRKPLNYAQISLTFTNIDKNISLDFQEICITRRLYRSGESEWRLNRNPVRLKDIHKLLREAGLGKNAFYIFEQGKIDELITSSPQERRNVFEEAAKIMHFKEKRREALRRLSQVDANLKRVHDIQGEVSKQIETLQKQAEEAKIFKAHKENLERLDKDLLIAKWQHNDNQQKVLEKEIREKVQEENNLKKAISESSLFLTDLRKKHHHTSAEAKVAYEKFFEAKKSKELTSFEHKTHQKRLHELFEQKSSLRQSLQAFHHRHLEEHKVYLGNQDQLKSQKGELTGLLTELEKSSNSIKSLEERVQEESSLRRNSQQELLKVVNSENQLGFDFKNTRSQLETTQERCDRISKEEKHFSSEIAEKKKALEELSLEKETKESERKTLKETLESLQIAITDKKASTSKQRDTLNHLSDEITAKNAKVSLLQKLKDELDGYGKGAKELLKYSKDSSHALFEMISPLTEWIMPQKGYEVCLSSLLGPYFQTLIVKKRDGLKLALKTAEENKLFGFSILCLEDLDKANASSQQKIAKSNVIADHFLNHVSEEESVTDTLRAETLIGKKYFFDEKKVLHNLSQEKNNLFLRETELRNSYQDLLKLEKEHLKLQEIYKNEVAIFDDLNNKQTACSQKNQQLKMGLVEIDLKTKSCQENLSHIENRSLEQTKHRGELLQALESLDAKQKELSKKYEHEQSKRSKLESHFKKIETQFENNFNTLKENRSLKQSLDGRIKSIERQAQNLQEHIKIFESKSADFEEQVEKMNFETDQNETNYQKLEKESSLFVEQEKKLSVNLQLANTHYHSFEDALENLEKEQKEKDETLTGIRSRLEAMQQADIELNNKRAEVHAENNLYFKQIFEKYELDVECLLSYDIEDQFSIPKTEREVRKLRRTLDGFTEINLKAVADCREQEERFTFLQSQIDDLNLSQEKLTAIIAELDNTSRKMFIETFENIRTHFKKNYALLFDGGEADLKLTSPEDVLESGIEIIAQPPGKKMRSIQQLSGGEKCLTAVALLFALFETQSIPFCILDEIDAPLDDTNVERFTKVLKQFVKNHQFIIITHNKRTMAMADILLGISMEEKGVTKVIPFQFNEESKVDTPKVLA